MTKFKKYLLTCLPLLLVLGFAFAQDDEPAPDCLPENLAQQQATFQQFLTSDFEADPDLALANLFRLGSAYQEMALRCGYAPTEPEIGIMVEQVLDFASLESLIAAQSVGEDVDQILIDLETVVGDPLNGQLLYDGQEPALGGAILGCSGCHEEGLVAPATVGTWTRVNDDRLALPEFEGYTVTQYLVESIVQPDAYIAPDFQNLMPPIYHNQLDSQQLADIVAFLESQDQFLDDE